MSKKFFSVIATALVFSLFFSATKAVAVDMPSASISAPYINARCAIAIDSKTKIVLFEKSGNYVVPMASTTKIVTALVALKYGDLDKKVEISEKASKIRGSTVGYKKGEQITIKELVYGLMLRSGNDAAIAIAEGISGSVEEFLKLMNEYAVEIGLPDTHFESPHGLDSVNHYTTAYDLALVTAKAKEIKEFNDIVSAKDVDGISLGFTRNFHNINKILWQIPEANGVKTGYTGQAGKCLVSSIKYGDSDIIIVVLNSNTRWKETSKIYDYIVTQYEFRKIANKGDIIGTAPVYHGKTEGILKCPEDIIVPIKKSSLVTKKVIIPSNAPAPVEKGNRYGKLDVYEDDRMIYSALLEIENNVSKKSLMERIIYKKRQ